MTQLDDQIATALRRLHEPDGRAFDMAAYIAAFEQSARNKADEVLARLQESPFAGRRPVFVSIGGGDGTELDHLLHSSDAHVGVLVESVRPLAEAARSRSAQLGGGRTIEVFEGDAQDKLQEAMNEAYATLRHGRADYVVVTCHAVIHELYDRSRSAFDIQSFLGRIFSDQNIPTWFSYREPGVPEGWPGTVLVKADCAPQSLLTLAEEIARRHHTIRDLSPKPQVMGDHIRLNRIAAMELIVKLFYLEDLQHEINERSTSVLHSELINRLHFAIGPEALKDRRGAILPWHGPTQSFIQLWSLIGVQVLGEDANGSQLHLGVPPSQARVVAWRFPASFVPANTISPPVMDATVGTTDITFANEALRTNDTGLLTSILISRGRAWIELQDKADAIGLLQQIARNAAPDSLLGLWTNYLLSIDHFFADHNQSFSLFSETAHEMAVRSGLGPLFAAERMEGCRKRGDHDQAIALANAITTGMQAIADPNAYSPLERYVEGTSRFLVANFLRQGGQYRGARSLIEGAQLLLNTAVPSHATELRHCQYALQVCASMLGDPGSEVSIQPATAGAYRFAEGLLQLTYAHAAWSVEQFDQAIRFAGAAATDFEHVGATRYVTRALQTRMLLVAWLALSTQRQIAAAPQEAELHRAISLLTSQIASDDLNWLRGWLPKQRPSRILGLLQFARAFGTSWDRPVDFVIPRTVEHADSGLWQWTPPITARSLKEADATLRAKMSIAPDRRLPLLAD